jgi:tetratricopeptide (TPR) repeat protein
VAIDPGRAGAWSGKAEALSQLGQYQECIFSANKALDVNPEEWLAYSDRASCETSMSNFAAAEKDYQTYVDNIEAAAAPLTSLGLAQHKNNHFEEAISSYTKALELDSSYYFAYINRGQTYVILKKYKEALADNNKALEFGDIPLAYSGRGDAYYGLQEYKKAIDNYNKAIELYPADAHNYCYLSLTYFEVGKYQDSIDAAESSHKIDPNCGGQRLYETEARSYYALKNYDQALVYINKALAMGNYSFGHYYRGIIYQSAGKTQEAIQDLELFLSIVQYPEDNQDKVTDAKARLAQLKK